MECSNRLDELVVKYENTLFRAALAILGDVQEAEDAVQDTFLRYLEKRPAFRDGEHERAWLATPRKRSGPSWAGGPGRCAPI